MDSRLESVVDAEMGVVVIVAVVVFVVAEVAVTELVAVGVACGAAERTWFR